MPDLGVINPGKTIYIEFDSFAGATGASITLSGLAVTDVEVYRDGSVTQRSSDSGYTLLDTDGIDVDTITGIHGLSIDLADNTDAGFWRAGSHYRVVISSVTIDTQTVNFTAATFRIGYEAAILNTTIATLATQTSFTLTDGPAEDDALNGCIVLIHDVASAVQKGFAVVSDYTGASKTVTLTAGTTFTAAATDNISFFPPTNAAYGGGVAYSTTRGLAGTALPNAAADAAGGLPISDAGGLDLDTQFAKLDTIDDFLDTEVAAILAAVDTEVGTIVSAVATAQADLDILTGADGATLATLQGNYAPAKAGDLMGLANDAITAAKYDESTAFPLTAVNGSTLTEAGGTGDHLTALATAANLATVAGYLDTEIAAILAAVDTEIAAILVDTGTDIPATLAALFTTALTEAYRGTGATGTVAQLLYELLANTVEHANSGTTRTAKKLDGSTTAKTYTYDDAVNPTSITETT